MVPISHYYIDREPPNSASVRDLISRKSTSATTPQSASFPPTIDASQAVVPEGSVAVPTESHGGDGNIPTPPTPAAKDAPTPEAEETPSQPEGIEPEAHPKIDDVEGPVTTTVAVPADGTAMAATDSQGGRSTTDDHLEEISLGGRSVKGDGEEEEVDLS
jgi:hypothetical protein